MENGEWQLMRKTFFSETHNSIIEFIYQTGETLG